MDRRDLLIERLEATGWTVDADAVRRLEDNIKLRTPDQLSIVTNRFRIQLITSLARHPESVKELAERFELPTTRLYHHLKMLEEAQLVRTVATRRSGARTERCYAAVRSGIDLSPDLLTGHSEQVADAVAKLVGLAGQTAAEAVRAGRLLGNQRATEGVLAWVAPRLTNEQRAEIASELEALATRAADFSSQNAEDEVGGAEPTIMLLLAAPDVLVPE